MLAKVQNYIRQHKLLTTNAHVIVGVSGGADSVVLLHVLLLLGYDCVIAHCNFHLRMEESKRDEEFVRNLSKSLHLPFYSIDFETTKYAKEQHKSIEMAARDLRYEWFYQLSEKLDAQAIAVAHHADDSIETMLMNLVRGTGLRGMTGISPRNGKVIRPLLCCTREEIENYIIGHDLDNITDSTNATLDYQRNKFRNVVLPLLEEINPSVRQTLYNSLERFEGTLAIYNQAIDNIKNKIVLIENDLIKLDIEEIKKQIDVPTVLYELLQPYGFGKAVLEQIIIHLEGESGKLFYSDTHRLLKDREYLIINKIELNLNEEFFIPESKTEIAIPFPLKISKIKLSFDFRVSKEKNCIHVDASRLNFPLHLRRWNEGDSFYPFGMNNRKKISDFFIDNKLSIIEKEQSWLLLSGDEIVWVVGQRMDNRYRVTDETKDVFQFSIS